MTARKGRLPRRLRERAARTAGYACGYCRTPEAIAGFRMSIEHIIPDAKGGETVEESLWLSCHARDEFKGARVQGRDPLTGKRIRLWNPRRQRWHDHFSSSYDRRDTNPPASRKHKEILQAALTRVDVGELCGCYVCSSCNLKKGPNLSGRDPLTGNIVRLFHPRRQRWHRHFRWLGAVLVGRTQVGRATVAVLDINAPHRIELRQPLIDQEEWPGD